MMNVGFQMSVQIAHYSHLIATLQQIIKLPQQPNYVILHYFQRQCLQDLREKTAEMCCSSVIKLAFDPYNNNYNNTISNTTNKIINKWEKNHTCSTDK